MDKVKKIVVPIAGFFVMCILFTLIWKGLHYILIDDTESNIRVGLHEFYSSNDIDTVFLGASHCQSGFDIITIDRELGTNSYNLGSTHQPIDVSFLLMEEAIKSKKINQVFVELSYNMAIQDLHDPADLVSVYIVTDYLNPSVRKSTYLAKRASEGTYISSFLPARRNWQKIFDLSYIKTLNEKKQTPFYKEYGHIKNDERGYEDRGFIGLSNRALEDGTITNWKDEEVLELNAIPNEWAETIKKMVRYCNSNGVKITFVSTPMASYRQVALENYDDFIRMVNNILEGSEAEYIDFNLLREKYWDDSNKYFYDSRHLNSKGAEEFGKIFASYIKGEISKSELFYSSIKEKYDSIKHNFYGLQFEIIDETNTKCELVCGNKNCLEYRVFIDNDGSKELIQDWQTNQTFLAPTGYTGKLYVEIKYDYAPESVKEYEMDIALVGVEDFWKEYNRINNKE